MNPSEIVASYIEFLFEISYSRDCWKGWNGTHHPFYPPTGYNTPHLFREVQLQHLLGDVFLFWGVAGGHTDPDGRNLGPVGDSSISLLVTHEKSSKMFIHFDGHDFSNGVAIKHHLLSPKVSGTQNGGTEPYKAILGVSFPLHKPYPYSLHR